MANLSVLTPQEMDIFLFLFKDQSNPSMAAEIFISEKLIGFYVDYVQTIDGASMRLPGRRASTPEKKVETRD
jgi:hypothetical protein